MFRIILPIAIMVSSSSTHAQTNCGEVFDHPTRMERALRFAKHPFEEFRKLKERRDRRRKWAEKEEEIAAIGGLADLALYSARAKLSSDQSRDLLASIMTEEFYDRNPFSSLSSYRPFVEILEKGIDRFERRIFRTGTNVNHWNSSYDVVHYEIFHRDGTRTIVIAHKEGRVFGGFGAFDTRQTRVFVYTGTGISSARMSTYENWRYLGEISRPLEEAMADAKRFVEESLENRGMFELERPTDHVDRNTHRNPLRNVELEERVSSHLKKTDETHENSYTWRNGYLTSAEARERAREVEVYLDRYGEGKGVSSQHVFDALDFLRAMDKANGTERLRDQVELVMESAMDEVQRKKKANEKADRMASVSAYLFGIGMQQAETAKKVGQNLRHQWDLGHYDALLEMVRARYRFGIDVDRHYQGKSEAVEMLMADAQKFIEAGGTKAVREAEILLLSFVGAQVTEARYSDRVLSAGMGFHNAMTVSTYVRAAGEAVEAFQLGVLGPRDVLKGTNLHLLSRRLNSLAYDSLGRRSLGNDVSAKEAFGLEGERRSDREFSDIYSVVLLSQTQDSRAKELFVTSLKRSQELIEGFEANMREMGRL